MPESKRRARKSVVVWSQTERDLAKRRPAKVKDDLLEIDPANGKITPAEVCGQYLKTVQHQKAKPIERKTLIVQRLKDE